MCGGCVLVMFIINFVACLRVRINDYYIMLLSHVYGCATCIHAYNFVKLQVHNMSI